MSKQPFISIPLDIPDLRVLQTDLTQANELILTVGGRSQSWLPGARHYREGVDMLRKQELRRLRATLPDEMQDELKHIL